MGKVQFRKIEKNPEKRQFKIPKVLSRWELEADVCREDFFEFVKRMWDQIIPEKPVWNWHIPYLCGELQYVAELVFEGLPLAYDLLVNIPPGTTKSTICSIMFPAWVWTRMPSARIIAGSYSYKPLALDFARKSRMVIQSEKYVRLFGDMRLKDSKQNAKGYYVNRFGGSRSATGVGAFVMGSHAHFLIVDDPIDPIRALSEAELKKSNDWMFETLPTRKVDKEVSVTLLIMQRLHEDDPSGVMLEKARTSKHKKVKHICLPADLEHGGDIVSPPELKEKYIDGVLDPKRLSKRVIENLRVDLGMYAASSQLDQRPTPRGGGMFHVDKISIVPVAPKHVKKRVRFWDKAGTDKGGAFTVGLLLSRDLQDRLCIEDVIRGQWDTGTRETIIEQTAQIDGKSVIVGIEQEPGSGGKESAENTVRRLMGYTVRVERPTGDKTVRADPFSSQVNMGNVSMVKADWNREFLKEYRLFPVGSYKDQVDAGSGAFTVISRIQPVAGALEAEG